MQFAFSLMLAIYIRVEAVLLIPIFAVCYLALGENGAGKGPFAKMKSLWRTVDAKILLLTAAFLLIIGPEIYATVATRPELLINALPFINQNAGIFSFSYLYRNLVQNTSFLMGGINRYPIAFIPNITVFAIIGIACLLVYKKQRNNRGVLLLLILLFLCYFIFYAFYFSGSILKGGSVRFMLVVYPPLAILAAFGVYGLAEFLVALASNNGHRTGKRNWFAVRIVSAVLVAAFFVVLFVYRVPFLRNPNYLYSDFPVIPNGTAQNDSYSLMYTNRSLSFILNNYGLVQNDCLVISPSPYLWYGLNRSSAVVNIYDFPGSNLKNYSCVVLDYSYYCTISLAEGMCKNYTSRYKLKTLATEPGDMNGNFSLYQLLNYTQR